MEKGEIQNEKVYKNKKVEIIKKITIGIIFIIFFGVLIMSLLNKKSFEIQDKVCKDLSDESELLRLSVVIEMHLAGYHNDGKPDIFHNSFDPWYQTTPGWFYQNGISLMANYLFNNTDYDRIFTDINTEGKTRLIGNNLNWDMIQKYPESYYPWSYKFKERKNISNQYKFILNNTPTFTRWRNIINNIFDWKYRVEKNKYCSIKLPSFEDFRKQHDADSLKKTIDFYKLHIDI